MLLSSGAGSVVSKRWIANPARVWLPLTIVASALLVDVWILPPILNSLVGAPFPAKLLISACMLTPLGFVMGMPFPAGLRALAANRGKNGESIEWAWAMNAASSVLGSVLAIVIAIQFGLNVTLICGAVSYLLALLLRGKLLVTPSTA
jgi:hypothetical protein